METVLMHGPGISDPSKTVEREVPEADVQAYRNAGYVEGGLPKAEKVAKEVVEGEARKAKPTKGKPKGK